MFSAGPIAGAARSTVSGRARRRWAIAAAGAVVVAAVIAVGLNLLLARLVRPPDGSAIVSLAEVDEPMGDGAVVDRDEHRRSGRAPATGPSLNSYVDPILGRSLFDSASVGQDAAGIASGDDGEVAATDLGYVLILTSVASPALYSTALLESQDKDARPELFGIGDAIADATIEEIVRRRIYVRRGNGALEYLEIGADQKKTSRPAAGSSRKKKGKTDWDEGITKVDENHYRVERSALDAAMGNLDALSRGARVMPKTANGKRGYQISHIKRDSPYKKLGLRHNDVIVGVNGNEVSRPDQALELFNQLKNSSDISLEIVRKGEDMNIQYDIF